LFGHFVNPAWHIATDCGPEDYALTDMEFMRHHGAPSRMAVSMARLLSVSVYAPLSRLCAMKPRMATDCIAWSVMWTGPWSMPVATQNIIRRSCALSFVVGFSMVYSRRQLWAKAREVIVGSVRAGLHRSCGRPRGASW